MCVLCYGAQRGRVQRECPIASLDFSTVCQLRLAYATLTGSRPEQNLFNCPLSDSMNHCVCPSYPSTHCTLSTQDFFSASQ